MHVASCIQFLKKKVKKNHRINITQDLPTKQIVSFFCVFIFFLHYKMEEE